MARSCLPVYIYDTEIVKCDKMRDVYQAVLSANYSSMYSLYVSAVGQGKGGLAKARFAAAQMRGLLADYDAILSTDSNFMLGPWIRNARLWGTTPDEKVSL